MCPVTIYSPVTPVDVTPVGRARALLGTRFRLHGRDVQNGIDCVGLIALVYDWCDQAPTGYALRGGNVARWAAMLDGLAKRRSGPMESGDIILMAAGPAQYHLGIWTGHSLIHADAGIGRVVETPGSLCWPVLGVWCVAEEI